MQPALVYKMIISKPHSLVSVLALAILCASVASCKLKKRERGERSGPPAKSSSPKETVKLLPSDLGPAYSIVKERLLSDPKSCFLPDVALCLDDDELIAEVLGAVMKHKDVVKRFGTELPSEGRAFRYVFRQAQQLYRLSQQKTEERRKAIESLLERRYNSPVVQVQGSRIVADHGFLPGPIEPYRNGFRLHESPFGNGRSWRPADITRFLAELVANYPEAKSFQLLVKAPNFGGFQSLKVTYDTRVDRIRFENQPTSTYYLSKRLDGDLSNLADRGISLVLNKMHSCSTRPQDIGGPCTPSLN